MNNNNNEWIIFFLYEKSRLSLTTFRLDQRTARKDDPEMTCRPKTPNYRVYAASNHISLKIRGGSWLRWVVHENHAQVGHSKNTWAEISLGKDWRVFFSICLPYCCHHSRALGTCRRCKWNIAIFADQRDRNVFSMQHIDTSRGGSTPRDF